MGKADNNASLLNTLLTSGNLWVTKVGGYNHIIMFNRLSSTLTHKSLELYFNLLIFGALKKSGFG